MSGPQDNAPCLIFSFGDNGLLNYCNHTLLTVLGYDEENLLGTNVETLFTVSTRIFFQTHFFPLLRMHGHADEIYITVKSKNGERIPLLISAVRKQEGDVAINCCAGLTVPRRKQFEDELIAAKKLAEESLTENKDLLRVQSELKQQSIALDQRVQQVNLRNEELRQLNKVLTHDLQEPVRKMNYLATQANNLYPESLVPEVENLFKKMAQAASQMQSVLSSLQQYVWIVNEDMKVEEQNLNHLLLVAQSRVEKEEQMSIKVESNLLPAIEGSGKQLTTMFYHLLKNAAQYRKPGTAATVRIFGTAIQENRFRHTSDKYSFIEVVKLEMQDDGIGFDPANNEFVFDLLRRQDNQSRRSVGLALCRKIVELHGGSIKADGKLGAGLKLTIILPLARQD